MSAGLRGFLYTMFVLTVLVLGLIAYEHWADPTWRATHMGCYGYMIVYALAVTNVTFWVTSGSPDLA